MGWTISWEEFMIYMTEFTVVSEEIGDDWMWQGDKNTLGGAYLVKKIKQHMPNSYDPKEEVNETENYGLSEEIEDTHTASTRISTRAESTWEYHILYSQSYASPVLYFNAFYSNGRLIPLEVLWKYHCSENEALQNMRWEALSQQEHPILRRPFNQLHPCKTAEFLSSHKGSSTNPVVTWLSSIGPTVGLHLDNCYSCLVNKEISSNKV